MNNETFELGKVIYLKSCGTPFVVASSNPLKVVSYSNGCMSMYDWIPAVCFTSVDPNKKEETKSKGFDSIKDSLVKILNEAMDNSNAEEQKIKKNFYSEAEEKENNLHKNIGNILSGTLNKDLDNLVMDGNQKVMHEGFIGRLTSNRLVIVKTDRSPDDRKALYEVVKKGLEEGVLIVGKDVFIEIHN